jgi:CBS domain-containing protein
MKVSEVMTKKPVCCWPSSSTLSAALLMQETDTGVLPVIQDRFTPTLVGVVTDRDLCLHVVASGRDPRPAGLTDV